MHELTCAWCPGAIIATPETTSLVPTLAPGETTTTALTTSAPGSGGQIISRPSSVPYCPLHFVDCGTCRCVPLTSCGFCPGAWSPSPHPAPGNGRPSVVPGCPASHVDCGTCRYFGFEGHSFSVLRIVGVFCFMCFLQCSVIC